MVEHGLDVVALAKLYEDMGQWETAARLFERGLEMEMPEADFWLAVERLSRLQKRRGDMETAVGLWERAASQGHVYAHVELAKYHEHQRRDYPEAMKWTRSAVGLVNTLDIPRYIYNHWLEDLNHRLERLTEKIQKQPGNH
jgi:tetratricopeptide (TPR) repeat protein